MSTTDFITASEFDARAATARGVSSFPAAKVTRLDTAGGVEWWKRVRGGWTRLLKAPRGFEHQRA